MEHRMRRREEVTPTATKAWEAVMGVRRGKQPPTATKAWAAVMGVSTGIGFIGIDSESLKIFEILQNT
jgi:hypothetical protein